MSHPIFVVLCFCWESAVVSQKWYWYNWATLWRSRLILQPRDLRSNTKNSDDPSRRRLWLMVESQSHPQVIGLFSGSPFFFFGHTYSILRQKQMGPSSEEYMAGGKPEKLNTWDVTATLGGFRWDIDSMIPFLIRSQLVEVISCNLLTFWVGFIDWHSEPKNGLTVHQNSKFGGFHMLMKIHKMKGILSPYFKWTNQRLCRLIHVEKICDIYIYI